MNKIEIRKHMIPYGYETDVFFIDGKPLYEYMAEWLVGKDELYNYLKELDDYAISWDNNYEWEGESLFMKYILSQNSAITPILLCPEDFDFSCIVIVADVVKHKDSVIWKRIGSINHINESFEIEKKCGILHTESYTEEDWKKYGDNIALEKVDSPEWSEWIGENFSEEIFRRRINYTYPYYQDEDNIEWIYDCNWEFDKEQYDKMVESCYTKLES